MNEVEDIRLTEFRQLKKEIRGSKDHLIVGIDVAKEKPCFFWYGHWKTLFRRLIFGNTIEGFEKLLTEVRATQLAQGLPKAVFGLEPTANYHKPLGEHLIKCGRMVVLVSGVAVKRNRELLDGRWDEHDTKDAANIADLISQGKCLFYEYPEMEHPGSAHPAVAEKEAEEAGARLSGAYSEPPLSAVFPRIGPL